MQEFPGVCPRVVRYAVEETARAANALACGGANVCGVGLELKDGHLRGSTIVLVPLAD